MSIFAPLLAMGERSVGTDVAKLAILLRAGSLSGRLTTNLARARASGFSPAQTRLALKAWELAWLGCAASQMPLKCAAIIAQQRIT